MENNLKHLFSPIKIKDLEIPNRSVMPPMGCHLENRDATVSEANLAYISKQASGGIGLVITEITAVHHTGALGIGVWDDGFIPGLTKMAEAIHQGGAKAAMQLAPFRPGKLHRPEKRLCPGALGPAQPGLRRGPQGDDQRRDQDDHRVLWPGGRQGGQGRV